MGWVLRLVESGAEGLSDSIDVLEIERPGDLGDLADLGLTHAERSMSKHGELIKLQRRKVPPRCHWRPWPDTIG